MFGHEAASEAFTLLRHALDGFEPVLLAGVVECNRARNDPLSNAIGGGAHEWEQHLPLSAIAQIISGEGRKGHTHESRREDERSKPHGTHLLAKTPVHSSACIACSRRAALRSQLLSSRRC